MWAWSPDPSWSCCVNTHLSDPEPGQRQSREPAFIAVSRGRCETTVTRVRRSPAELRCCHVLLLSALFGSTSQAEEPHGPEPAHHGLLWARLMSPPPLEHRFLRKRNTQFSFFSWRIKKHHMGPADRVTTHRPKVTDGVVQMFSLKKNTTLIHTHTHTPASICYICFPSFF